jgi:hypothetical protein
MNFTDHYTEEDHRADQNEGLSESVRDDALDEFYGIASKLAINVQHLVPKDLEGEAVKDCHPDVSKTIDQITQLGICYTYRLDDDEGVEYFDYDFSDYSSSVFSDELGYYKESANV